MRFLVYGAGAIGCVHGAFLARAGHEVVLYGRQVRMQAIRAEGLAVTGIWGDFKLDQIETAWALNQVQEDSFDVVLLTVRAYDTANALEDLAKLTKGETIVVSLQNGLGNIEQIAGCVGVEKTVAGRVIFGARIPQPTTVEVTVIADPTRLGPVGGGVPFEYIQKIASVLDQAGIPTQATLEVMTYIWAKVFYNSALNPLSALLNQTYGELSANPHSRRIMDKVIEEAFKVAKAEKIHLWWKTPDEYRTHFYQDEVPPTSLHRSSMLQAIEQGKRTEIDFLNGAIVQRGQKHGIDVSCNQVLTDLIRAKELVGNKR